MTEQNAPERILANISHLTLVKIDQAGMMRLADEIEYVRADLYDAAWNEAIEAAAKEVGTWFSEIEFNPFSDPIRALRREASK